MAEIAVVFPNRRAGLFFQKELANVAGQTMWAPKVLTIEDLFREASGLTVPDQLTLIFELFKVYRQYLSQETFDGFYFWGDMLLHDFDELDKYLVPAEHVFSVLTEHKRIEQQFSYLDQEQIAAIRQFWNTFNPPDLSEEQEQFLGIWQHLAGIYKDFRKRLQELGYGYNGMIHRKVAYLIEQQEVSFAYSSVVFAGFNALTHCEKKLFSHFQKQGKARFFWDADQYYLNDERQEAGLFLRQNRHQFPSPTDGTITQHLSGHDQQVELVGVPLHAGQAKVAGSLLNQYLADGTLSKEELSRTAVVLPDEHMLFPLLHSLPDQIDKVNVTMGYPLRNTPVYSLIEHLVDLQENLKDKNEGPAYYHRQVVDLLRHPYLYFQDMAFADEKIHEIEKENKVYLRPSDLQTDKEGSLFPKVFRKVTGISDLFDYLMDLLATIHQRGSYQDHNHPTVEREYLYQLYTQLKRLHEVLEDLHIEEELALDTFWKLFRQLVEPMTTPFTGEPLEGLQVMGVLETRCLDFDHVIMLSMNEGTFPANNTNSSFIPYHLRKGFGLPTPEHQDAISAYHFYRLLQRAKTVTLLYNTEPTSARASEMSRFLYQLKYESPIEVKELLLTHDIHGPVEQPITIQKSEDVMAILKKNLLMSSDDPKGLSPSAINSYLNCKLQFYFRYVAGLEEEDEVQEEIDPILFGNILHDTMEALYSSLQEKKGSPEVTEEDFGYLKSILPGTLDDQFKEQYAPEDPNFTYEGRNIIVRRILGQYTEQILAVDQQRAPFTIIGLEKADQYLHVPVQVEGVKDTVFIRGFIDRVDDQAGRIRVIDYKTGSDDKRFVDVASLFDRDNKKRNKAALQTLLYGLLYARNQWGKEDQPITSGLYNVKEMFSDRFSELLHMQASEGKSKYQPVEDIRSLLPVVEELLQATLQELFDPAVPFDQTDNLDICRTCPYAGICHRE